MRASTPLVCSRAFTLSRPSASTVKVTRMRAAPAAIGGMPRSSKRARLRQSCTRSRSPCTTCMRQRRLAVLVGGEVLRLGAWGWFRCAARCARPGRPWSRCPATAESRPAAAGRPRRCCRPADWPGWRRPSATTSSGLRLVSGSRPKNSRHGPLDLRHAGGAADQHHALHFVLGQLGVAQGLAHRRHGACREVGGDCFELARAQSRPRRCFRRKPSCADQRLRRRTAVPWRRAPPS